LVDNVSRMLEVYQRSMATTGVIFTNILRTAFSCESFAQICLVLYLHFRFVFFAQEYRSKGRAYNVGEIDNRPVTTCHGRTNFSL
jgi:hypothetical protein